MNVKTLCLAILYDNDASGYEIRKLSTEGEYAYFVDASFGSIYPALAKLEDDELVTSKVTSQEGRPAKKVYTLTTKGQDYFKATLFEPLEDDTFRSEFLLFAHFVRLLPQSLVEARINERIEHLDKSIEKLENLSAKHEGPENEWILDYGTSCMRVARDYLTTHMHKLIALAKPDAQQADAAE